MQARERKAALRGLWPAAGLALLVACGGGGGSNGTGAFPDGSGSGFGGSGAGGGSFGGGAGAPPFGGGAGGVGDGPRPSPDPVVVVSDDAIQGAVLSSASGSPVSGAAVRFSATTLATNGEGLFSQATSLAIPRLVIEGSATGFEPFYGVNEVLGSVPSVSILRLTPHGVTSTVTVASGGAVSDAATAASLTVPANALLAAGGGAAPATVDIRVTAVNVGSDSNLLSGDYTDDTGTPVQTFGAVTVTPSVALEVVSGQQLVLQVPVSTRSAVSPASANLYYFDTVAGQWTQEGTATFVAGALPYYQASVTRFAQWMVGLPISGAVSVSGCVVDDLNNPAANVRMSADGINYSSINSATTNASGQFTVVAPASSNLVLQGRRGAYLTNALAVSVPAGALSIPNCLTIPTTNAATMRLTWGANPLDIDSHLRVPGGSHVYWPAGSRGSLSAEPYANLDVDDTDGRGPEVTTIRRPKVGIYRFYLHNYSQSFGPGMTGSPTRVELNYAGRTVVFSPPAGEGTALYWHLFDLEISANCTMTLYRYNRWRADEPQNPNAAGAATECTPS